MLYSLPASREWSLLYLGRRRDDMLFAEELIEEYGDRVTVWATAEHGGRAQLSEFLDSEADVYACGSSELLATLEDLVAPERLHVERFEPLTRISARDGDTFEVTAARSGKTVNVTPDLSTLEALEGAGVMLPASCRRGTCGTCEVGVVEGIPEHLDSVMSDADKDEIGVMYPCVSRSRTPRLVLDV
jgi:ferredoxin